MRKPVSKRRWKARFRQGQWIPREAILNHCLETLVAGGTRRPDLDAVRRQTRYEALGGWPAFSAALRPSSALGVRP